jgi:hypothetical protein
MSSTKVNSEVVSNVAVESKAEVDAGFVKVFAAVDKASEAVGGKWAKVARYAIENNLTRPVILESLKSMGKKTETAQSLTSRIMDLMKPENAWKLDKMEAGELSVRDARSTTISLAPDGKTIVRAAITQRPASVRIADFLVSAANVAFVENYTLASFIEEATKAYQFAEGQKPKAKSTVTASTVTA